MSDENINPVEPQEPIEPQEPQEPQEPGEPPAPPAEPPQEPEEPKVPLKALEDERRKRQDLERRIQALETPPPKEPTFDPDTFIPPGHPPRPEVDQYDSYEDFVMAAANWEGKRVLAVDKYVTQKNEAEHQHQTATEKFVSSGAAKYADFHDVAMTGLIVTPTMRDALVDSDVGADVAYYLGKNPEEAKRIAGLGVYGQVREIGKIEAKLSTAAAPVKRETQAPEPITPVSTEGKTTTKDPSQMSDKEFADWRRRQINSRR
jgi:hypothetical protein